MPSHLVRLADLPSGASEIISLLLCLVKWFFARIGKTAKFRLFTGCRMIEHRCKTVEAHRFSLWGVITVGSGV